MKAYCAYGGRRWSTMMMTHSEARVIPDFRSILRGAMLFATLILAGCSSDSGDQPSADGAGPCPGGAECLNFDGASDVASTGLIVQNGTVSLDATKPRGASGKSLHLVGMTSYSGRAAVSLRPKGFPSGSFYGRAWMYSAQPNPAGKNVTLIEAAGTATSPAYQGGAPFEAQFRFGIQNEGPLFKSGYETPGWYATPPTGPHTDCYQHSTTKMPVNQWFCAVWQFDAAAQRLKLEVDGKTVLETANRGDGCVGAAPDPTLENEWVYPAAIDSLTFGWQEYEAGTGTRELWIDDLAIGSAPIGCD